MWRIFPVRLRSRDCKNALSRTNGAGAGFDGAEHDEIVRTTTRDAASSEIRFPMDSECHTPAKLPSAQQAIRRPAREETPTRLTLKGAIVTRSLKPLRRSPSRQFATPRLIPSEATLALASSYCRSQINFIKEHM